MKSTRPWFRTAALLFCGTALASTVGAAGGAEDICSAGSESSRVEAELVAAKAEAITSNPALAEFDAQIQYERGRKPLLSSCFACHGANGEGVAGVFPPLAKSDFLEGDLDRVINTVVRGMTGPVTVNGKSYNSIMPPQPLDDQRARLRHEQLG
ncbi:MAG: c-type cytochrome [Verrucomicrobiia bacterium]